MHLQVLCCFGSAACHLCCACCPPIRSSLSARIGYLCIIVVGIIISSIMLAPAVSEKLAEVRLQTYCSNYLASAEGLCLQLEYLSFSCEDCYTDGWYVVVIVIVCTDCVVHLFNQHTRKNTVCSHLYFVNTCCFFVCVL